MYIGQIGQLLKAYGRLARTAGNEEAYYADIRGLLKRMSRLKSVEDSTFASTYRIVMQDFLFEIADEVTLESGPFELGKRAPEAVLSQGVKRLEAKYGSEALDWQQFRAQVSG
jgi:hypothetical protein